MRDGGSFRFSVFQIPVPQGKDPLADVFPQFTAVVTPGLVAVPHDD